MRRLFYGRRTQIVHHGRGAMDSLPYGVRPCFVNVSIVLSTDATQQSRKMRCLIE